MQFKGRSAKRATAALQFKAGSSLDFGRARPPYWGQPLIDVRTPIASYVWGKINQYIYIIYIMYTIYNVFYVCVYEYIYIYRDRERERKIERDKEREREREREKQIYEAMGNGSVDNIWK